MKFWLVKKICREGSRRSPGVVHVVPGPVSGEWFGELAAGLENVVRENLTRLDAEALAGVARWCWQVSLVTSEDGERVAVRAVLHPVRSTYQPPGRPAGDHQFPVN